MDKAGNVSSSASDVITYDSIPPSVTSVVIADGAAYTNRLITVVKATATDASPIVRMRYSADGATWSAWSGYTTANVNRDLSADGGGSAQGRKLQYVQVMDAAGQVSGKAFDSIVYDSIAPVVSTVSINAGANLTNTLNVNVNSVGSDAGSGLDVIQALKQQPQLKVLMLTISEKDEDLMAAIEAGADGYLLKGTEPEALVQAIREVAAGQAVLSPDITAKVMKAAASSWSSDPGVSLSPREQEVLTELARGATTAEIAVTLVISTSTVKTHIHHILEKLDAANRTEAVARATTLGLIDPRS